MKTAYVFGASGEIGSSIVSKFASQDYHVSSFSRHFEPNRFHSIENLDESINTLEPADCVVWASGANLNDSINDYEKSKLDYLLEANLYYVVDSLSKLKNLNLLKQDCNLVIISSVWQDFSKQNKFSYTVSKSAVSGLIHSLAADLSPSGIRVNGVLPGVVDTEMTRAALTSQQIELIQTQTPTGELVSLKSVAELVFFLCAPESKGVNGQSIVVDGGWSVVRYV